jgi:hypothetical protein
MEKRFCVNDQAGCDNPIDITIDLGRHICGNIVFQVIGRSLLTSVHRSRRVELSLKPDEATAAR